jgi:hypothetical protein
VKRFQIVLNFYASKLLLNITHRLFMFEAFLDVLKKGVSESLSFLVNLRAKRFVRRMSCCILSSMFELLSSVKQGTNRRIIVHRYRLFLCKFSWPTMINRAAHSTSRPHEGCLGLDASHNSLRVNRNPAREVLHSLTDVAYSLH